MTGRLKCLYRVILRRLKEGENREEIFASYKLMTEDEKAEIIAALDAVETGESNA